MNKNDLWIEKYRPRVIDDIIMDDYTKNKVKHMMESKNLSNIIITGDPGIGKTTTLLCIARHLLGRHMKIGMLEMNASDDRGIKTVNTIELFCKKTFNVDDENCSKQKIVILDEADNMTSKAQRLINNLMQQYHSTTRFTFTCNTSSKILEAIQSRCMIFRYTRIEKEKVKNKLMYICEKEDVKYMPSGLDAIVSISRGDMRQAVSNLQLITNTSDVITKNSVYTVSDHPGPLIIRDIFLSCKKKDLQKAINLLYNLIDKGYSISDISISMIDTLKSNMMKNKLDEDTKIKYMEHLSKSYLQISTGIDTELQLTGCVARMCM